MAKRKRLTLPDPAAAVPGGAPEVKAVLRPGLETAAAVPPAAPPIAHVAAEASAAAALRELADTVAAVRAEGRMVLRLPLAAVDALHLARDRLGVDEAELAALVDSIRAHGQRMPVEVADLGGGRYGLISGWRRLTALARLHAETGEARFAEVLALVRRPESAAEAYVAMVEENELRLALSHYERARIVARCAELGVFPDARTALRTLFAAAPRARRSKIGAFLAVHQALDGALRHPAAVPERLGLAIAAALEAGRTTAAALRAALAGLPDGAGPEAEAAALAAALKGPRSAAGGAAAETAPAPGPAELRPGLFVEVSGGFLNARVTLSGPAVTPEFRERLEAWLREGR